MKKEASVHYSLSCEPGRHLEQLEQLRELHAFCSHDLRSNVGATVGVLRMLADDPHLTLLKGHPSFKVALKSAEDTLTLVDAKLKRLSLGFQVAWILTDQEPEGSVSDGAPDASGVSRLFVSFPTKDDLLAALSRYRPAAAFVSAAIAGADLGGIIQRLGPQMTKIFVFAAPSGLSLPAAVSAQERGSLAWSDIHSAWTRNSF